MRSSTDPYVASLPLSLIAPSSTLASFLPFQSHLTLNLFFSVWLCVYVCVCGVQRVNNYLVEHDVKGVMYDPQAEHGAVLFGKAKMALVVDWVRRGEREGEEYAD